MFSIIGKRYFHSSKESSLEDFTRNCNKIDYKPTPEQDKNAMYSGTEVLFEGFWDKDGNYYATHVNGVALVKAVKI